MDKCIYSSGWFAKSISTNHGNMMVAVRPAQSAQTRSVTKDPNSIFAEIHCSTEDD
jgi:hypothetical protein